MQTREELIISLKNDTRVLRETLIEKAFEEIDRADFVDDDYKIEAYEDYALPIGEGQTTSRPTTILFMIELLDVKRGDNILEVGFGSGFATALLSSMVGDSGHIYGVEQSDILLEKAKNNIGKYDHLNNITLQGRSSKTPVGLPEYAPYDKILVSAEAKDEIPVDLFMELKIGGIMVIPVSGTIYKLVKVSDDGFDSKEYPGFSFGFLS